VGDGLADERLRFLHLASILGCGTEASQRIRMHESACRATVSALHGLSIKMSHLPIRSGLA